eukprot:jgi/Bigna1/77641/fgenesh1_pg.49_\
MAAAFRPTRRLKRVLTAAGLTVFGVSCYLKSRPLFERRSSDALADVGIAGHQEDLESSVHKLEMGEFDVYLLNDGDIELPLAKMFPHISADIWQERFSDIQPDDIARLSSGCVLVVRKPERHHHKRGSLKGGGTKELYAANHILLDSALGIINPQRWPKRDLRSLSRSSAHLFRIGHYNAKDLTFFFIYITFSSACTTSDWCFLAYTHWCRHLLLHAANIRPEDIDLVVHTHLHSDHTGWNVIEDPKEEGKIIPLFSNAKHCVQEREWDFWTSSEDLKARTQYDIKLRPLEERGMMTKIQGRQWLTPGVEVVPCEGHTPGHQVIRIVDGKDSEKRGVYWIGDAMHHLAQVQSPAWSPVFDWDPEISAKSRIRLMKNIVEENAILLSPHFPYPGCGTIAVDNDSCDNEGSNCFRFIPMTKN